MKTDSGLSAYCHGNVDFPNVWERCWPTRAIPIYKGAIAPLWQYHSAESLQMHLWDTSHVLCCIHALWYSTIGSNFPFLFLCMVCSVLLWIIDELTFLFHSGMVGRNYAITIVAHVCRIVRQRLYSAESMAQHSSTNALHGYVIIMLMPWNRLEQVSISILLHSQWMMFCSHSIPLCSISYCSYCVVE